VPEDLKQQDPGATFADRLQRDLGASITLQFRRPLFDPTTGYAVQAEQSRLRAAELRQSAALADRQREILDLLSRWRSASARVTLARTSLERASDNLIRMRSLYAGGASSLLELLDALQQWDEARDRLADARSDARLAHWEGEIRR
jgi:outer membrane protein TolC